MSLYSLKNQRQFDLVNRYGKKITSPYFMLIFAKNFNAIEIAGVDKPILFGMKVSKKLAKRANVRNKIKRRIRHLMRLVIREEDLNLAQTALIFIPYKNFDTVEFALLYSELRKVLVAKNPSSS